MKFNKIKDSLVRGVMLVCVPFLIICGFIFVLFCVVLSLHPKTREAIQESVRGPYDEW